MDVFERGANFDPRLDPIVRIDARRLRARLSEYYEGPGAFDEVEIALGRGGYAPSFRRRQNAHRPPSQHTKRLIAVLPFEGWHPGGESARFGAVFTEELVSALGQLPGWQVRVCPASGVLPGLQPEMLVRGAITRLPKTVRVTVNLIRGSDGSLMASQRFERGEAQTCQLQQQVMEYVLTQLGERQCGGEETLRHYLQGRYLMNHSSPGALNKAVGCFEKVVARDPHSSRAWSGMAATLSSMIWLGAAEAATAGPKATHAAAKALEGEPHLPEVKTAAAVVMALVDGEVMLARRSLDSVIALHPHFVAARIARAAHCMLPDGRFGEARAELETALAADPGNASALYAMSLVQCAEASFEEARQTLEMLLKTSAEYPACWRQLAEVHRQLGNGQEALAAYQRYEELSPAEANSSSGGAITGPITSAAARAVESTAVLS